VHAASPAPTVAAFVHRTKAPRYLLLRRIAARGGWWQPVTGRVEATDADAVAAALREVREETGIEDALSVLELGFDQSFTGLDGRRYTERSFAVEVPDDAEARASPEHDTLRWMDLDEALARLHFPANRAALEALAERLGDRAGGGKRL